MEEKKGIILSTSKELELSEYNDFILKKELIKKYKIIDFHTHCFPCLEGHIPKMFRKQRIKNDSHSFFDLSCYPGNYMNFDFSKVSYRKWPETAISFSGISTLFELYGLKGVIQLLQSATLKRLLKDMESNSIEKIVLLPIQSLDGKETENTIDASKEDKRIIAFGSIHPNENFKKEKIDKYIKLGVKGFKINPHIWKINIDDNNVIKLIGLLSETGKPILSCSGIAVPYSFKNMPKSFRSSLETQNINKFKRILKTIPNLKLIFGHSGLEQNNEVINLMKKYKNTYAEISTQPAKNIRKMIDDLGSERLLYGSDYPFFNQAFPILSILKATDNANERKLIFSQNAERLLDL